MDKITRFNSENAQIFIFPNLTKRVEILEREKFLFLPSNWNEDKDLVVLKFIAQLKDYEIDYAIPTHRSAQVFQEIENAIKAVTNLELKDYAVKNRSTNLFYARLIFVNIAIENSVAPSIITGKIKRNLFQISKYINTHNNFFKFDPVYRRIYNDVMQEIKNNQVI